MFSPVPRRPDHAALEKRILDFWSAAGCFKRLVDRNRGNEKFRFLDGPITANGPMGVHHAWGRSYKDLFQRYKAMLGFDQRFQNGFDCQGLWVEVEVEKELGFRSKRDIEKLGIDRFVEKCKERVLKFSRIQTAQSIRIGQWMDWENSYYTMSEENNYSIWYFLKKCHERGFIYEGIDVMPWCARCGTAVSEMEIVTEGYRELTHKAVFLRLPLARDPGTGNRDPEFLLVWTTTPWTLTSNTACAVHPELTYVRARIRPESEVNHRDTETQSEIQSPKSKTEDPAVYILAEPLLLHVLGKDAEILEKLKGEALVGLRYRGPFDELAPQQGVVHRVVPWAEVSAVEGTGIVHIAPGCGREDFLLGRAHDLAVIAPLNEDGTFRPEFGWLAGRNSAAAAAGIFADLEKKGYLFRVEDYTHRYPVCWRCGEELVFRLVDEWFISMDTLRHEIMDSARRVRWIPEFGLERELDWLRNMSDWCISRKRYWGLALPFFKCDCGWFDVVGSREELKARAVSGWERFEGHTPHRPWVDEVRIACGKCGKPAARVKDVGSPWLDAGIVPFSTTYYLTDRDHWQEWFPFDFITESFPGQFRNWFYAILAMSTVLEKQAPFRTVLGYATVKAEDGRDMHKSWGNAIEVEEAAERMGADVMRWIFLSQNPTQNLLFGFHGAREVERKLLTFWNVYSFFVTYANIDRINPRSLIPIPHSLALLDRWILSRLNSLVKLAIERLDDFDPAPVPRAIEGFFEDLSTWYVRRSRRRFWKPALFGAEGSDTDKHAAYCTLYACLETLVRLFAPFMPFLAEEIYQNIVRPAAPNAPESVHLCPYPEPDGKLIDPELEREVELVRSTVSLGRAAREKARLKVRQPLSAAIIRLVDPAEQALFERHAEVIKEEINVRNLLFTHEQPAGIEEFEVAEQADRAVGVSRRLTRELEDEGLARELVHKVQNLRKEAGFEVTDRIRLYLEVTPRLATAAETFREYICRETLALTISPGSPADADIRTNVKVNNEPAGLALKRVRTPQADASGPLSAKTERTGSGPPEPEARSTDEQRT